MPIPSRRSWVVWGVGVFAYAVAVFHRTSLAVAVSAATERFDIGASMLSTFVVLQLLVYAGMQVPVGLLVDRFGPRVIIVFGGLVMASGQALLAFAHEPATAIVARVLVGAGDALTFISVLRLIPAWFPGKRVPLVTQLTGLIGQVGQIGSTFPLSAALVALGWTLTYLGAAAFGVLTAIIVFLAVRDYPPDVIRPRHIVGWREAVGDLRASFLQPGTRVGLWSHFSAQFSGMVFALLWGYPFLTVGQGYSPQLAGALTTIMVLAAAVIGPTLGQLTRPLSLPSLESDLRRTADDDSDLDGGADLARNRPACR